MQGKIYTLLSYICLFLGRCPLSGFQFILIPFQAATIPSVPWLPYYRDFMFTLRHITIGKTPLDEWSAGRSDHCVTTHSIHKWQTSMSPVGFETAIPASVLSQIHELRQRGHWDRRVYLQSEPNKLHDVSATEGQEGRNVKWATGNRKKVTKTIFIRACVTAQQKKNPSIKVCIRVEGGVLAEQGGSRHLCPIVNLSLVFVLAASLLSLCVEANF